MTAIIHWLRSRPAHALVLTAAYFVFVVWFHSRAQSAFSWLLSQLGRGPYTWSIIAVGALGLAAATVAIARRSPREHRSLVVFYWVATLAILPLAYLFLFALSSESVHFIEYALLVIPIFALLGRTLDTLLWVTLLGAIDEAYQYWIWHRDWGIYYDFNDVIINLLGAAMGVVFLLGAVDLAKLGLPKRPRSIWKSPPVLLVVVTTAVSVALYRLGHLSLAPDSSSETWILLNRVGPHRNFWVHVDWGKTFHVLRPVEALAWLAIIVTFYALVDHLIRVRPAYAVASTASGYRDRLHAILRRVTWSTNYIAVVDGLRFVAILAVVVYHIESMMPVGLVGGESIRTFLGYGNIGVQFFFAISGFILAVPMLDERLRGGRRLSLGKYYLRRLIRLEPPYLICLVGFFLLGLATHPGPDDLAHLGASSIYAHGIIYNGFSTINFVAWSLEIEAQFYLAMPLLAWLFFRGNRPWLRRVIMAAACIPFMVQQTRVHGHFPHGLFLSDQIQFFMAGIILADIYVCGLRERMRTRSATAWHFDIVATAAFAVVPWIMDASWQAARYVVPVAIGVWYYGAFRSVLWRRLLENRWIAALGGMCYTVYLYHWIILDRSLSFLRGFAFDSTRANLLLIGPVLAALVFAVSALLFLAFEKPFMGFRPARGASGGANVETTATRSSRADAPRS